MRVPTFLTVVAAVSLTGCSGGDSSTTPNSPAPVLTSVTISSTAQTVAVGQTLQLSASARDQNGNAIEAIIAWSSSATGTATVNATSGLVTAIAAGTVTITARATAGSITVSTTRQVVVTGLAVLPVLSSVTISAPATAVAVGATVQLSAAPKDQNGNAIAATITWGTSDGTKATVGAVSGLVSGVAIGTATITATATAAGVTVSATVQITVVAPQSPVLTDVVISPPAPSVLVGTTVQLSATAVDQNGAAMGATVTWGTSDASKATVGITTGLVTGVAGGTATITATATAGGVTLNRSVTVSVTALALSANVVATVNNTFVPATVEIGRTGTVTWTFQSLHNVVFASTTGTPADINDTDSGTAARAFNTVGTFAYICTLHTGMAGTVIVR